MIDVTEKTPLTIDDCKEGMVVYNAHLKEFGVISTVRKKVIWVDNDTGSWTPSNCYYVADKLPKHHDAMLAYAYGASIKIKRIGHSWDAINYPNFGGAGRYRAIIPDHPPISEAKKNLLDEKAKLTERLAQIEQEMEEL